MHNFPRQGVPNPSVTYIRRRLETSWCNRLSSLCTYCGTFAGDGLEAGLDACNRTTRAARLALKEIESSVLLEYRFRRTARVTRHVFLCKSYNLK